MALGKQSSALQEFPFAGVASSGNPAASDKVLQGTLTNGKGAGRLNVTLVATGDVPFTVTIQVSADGTTWNATTTNNNLSVVTNVVVVANGTQSFPLLLRPGADLYVRLLATGGAGKLQVQGGESIDFVPTY